MNPFTLTAVLMLFTALSWSMPWVGHALEPAEILVVANMNASQSKGLAKFYMDKRQIPKENLVLLFLDDKETCTRQTYETKVIPPIRRALERHPDIRSLVTVYGVPLRIASPGPTDDELNKLTQLSAKRKALNDLNGKEGSDKQQESGLAQINKIIRNFNRSIDKVASLDSELMLVKKESYDLNMWLANPFFLGWGTQNPPIKKSEVLMVSRLDGANPDIVKRIINDSIEAEKKGLEGTAYFDARWKDPGDNKVSGYTLYDRSIHRTARLMSKKTPLKVILNDDETLFQQGQGLNAAFYCGWYSLAKYIDAFTWQKGAVGFHIASAECKTLKNAISRVWCKKMLDKGVAATIGPVGEPYVQSFPLPEIFFDFLAEGYLTLAESYLISLPYLSWKMVLIGDPLYRINLKGPPKEKTSHGS